MNACIAKSTSNPVTEQPRPAPISFTPRVDVWETEHDFFVHADIPGVEPGNISLNFENGQLALLGKVNPVEVNPRSLLREYAVGDFHRTFAINEDIDASRISADYKNGVLTVKLPKREEIKPRKIAITV